MALSLATQEMPPSVQNLLAGAIAASIFALVLLGWRLSSGRPLIAQRPRHTVPWNVLPVLFLLLPTALTLLSGLLSSGEDSTKQALKPNDVWSYAVVALLVAAAVYFLLAAVYRATPADLGLPTNLKMLGEDVFFGSVGFVVVVGPLLLLNGALQQVFDSETVHPFIDQIVRGKEYSLFAAAAFAAVVQAPVFEETVFRLVLQGWLEKQEAMHTLAARQPELTSDELIEPVETENESTPERSQRLVPWLPHGWLSTVISALLFGFAHIGQGVAPVALVLLGVVLGYLYQRTHRIVSCMVLHALFNGFTMLIIWLSME